MREAPRRVEMRNERDIIYHGIIILEAESSEQPAIYYFSLYIFFSMPSSSVFARTRVLYAVFFHGRKATVTSGGEGGAVAVWLCVAPSSPTCPGDRTRSAGARAEGRASARPGKVDSRAARRDSGSPAYPPPIARPEDNAPVNGFRNGKSHYHAHCSWIYAAKITGACK